jgi:hypothetical protein
MKLHRVFLIALMTGILGVMGCGDDPAPSNGTGGTPSNGGGDASTACSTCDAQDRIPQCEERYDACVAADPGGNVQEKCTLAALEECGAF